MEFQLPQIVSMTSSEGESSISDDVVYAPVPVGVVARTTGDGEIVGPLSEPLERYLSRDLRKEVSRLKLRIVRKGPDANDHKKGYIALIRAHMKRDQPMPVPHADNNSHLWNTPQPAPMQQFQAPQPQPQPQMQMHVHMQRQSMHSLARTGPNWTVDDADRAWAASQYIYKQQIQQQDPQEYWPAQSLPRPPPPPPRSQTPPQPPAPPSQSPPPPNSSVVFASPPLELPSLMPSDEDEDDVDDEEDDYDMESPQNQNAEDAPTHIQSPQHLEPRELQFDDKPVDEPTNKPACVFVTDSDSGSDFGSDMDSDSGDDSDTKPDPVAPGGGGGDMREPNITFVVPTRPPRFVKKATDFDPSASISPPAATVVLEKSTDDTCVSPEPSVDDAHKTTTLSPAPRSTTPDIGASSSPEICDATREMTAPAKPSCDTQEVETVSQEPIDDANKVHACSDDTHEFAVPSPELTDDTLEMEASISEACGGGDPSGRGSCDNASEMEASSQESNDDTNPQEMPIPDLSDFGHAKTNPEPSANANMADSAVPEPPNQNAYEVHPLDVVIKHTQYWENRLTVSKRRICELYGELQGADAQEEEDADLLKDELNYYTRERKRALRSLLSDPVVT